LRYPNKKQWRSIWFWSALATAVFLLPLLDSNVSPREKIGRLFLVVVGWGLLRVWKRAR